jgi:hypothetical protein
MAEHQQGGFATFFGIPTLDATNGVKFGTTSTPAAVTAKIVSLSATPIAQEEETMDEDGDTVHISTYGKKLQVEITGYFHGSTLANAVSAQQVPDINTVVVLIGANGAKDFDTVAPDTTGKTYLLKAFNWTSTNSAKATFTATLKTEPGISSPTWYS